MLRDLLLSAYSYRIVQPFIWAVCFFVASIAIPQSAVAGSFLLSPSTGELTVGSTFAIKILLSTEGKSVNALDVDLRFPPDKLQLISPETSVSVISVWTSQPKFNNQTGTIRLQGGIPGGVNVQNAEVATLTFRVKAMGNAIIRFGDNSKILLNDGFATNDLSKRVDGLYTLTLPPPAGPVVTSSTHPNEAEWYSDPNVVLQWARDNGVQNYSYIFNQNSATEVDDVGDGDRDLIAYKGVPDGRHYFHIKALRVGVWGGLTHFGVGIDTGAPAEFPLEILPSSRTNSTTIIIKFATTDTLSGLDHYELKVISVSDLSKEIEGDGPLFFFVESPYVLSDLAPGSYDVILRAYDRAGNFREIIERVTITSGLFGLSTREGIVVGSTTVGWWGLLLPLVLLAAFLWYYARRVKKQHVRIGDVKDPKHLPESIRSQLEELKRFKSKYGAAAILLCMLTSGMWGMSPETTHAELTEPSPIVELAPPYVTTVSKDVSNSEIFYIGGKTENKDTTVTIFTQNLTTGETTSFAVKSDKKAEWFYRHNGFLTPGKYVLWTQASLGDIQSPPSAQIEMNVARAALEFGVTRFSYEALYLVSVGLLLLIVAYLIFYIVYHTHHHRRKKDRVLREVKEAEESIKRGFATLRRDIEREIQMIRKIGLVRPMTEEERNREDGLLIDLKYMEQRIGKEVWDVEKAEAMT